MVRENRGRRSRGRVVLGLMLVALGVVFTLDNLGWVEADRLFRFWPLVFVLVGLNKIIGAGDWTKGVFWILLAGVLLLHNLHIVSFSELWPLFLVALGAMLIFRSGRSSRGRFDHDHADGADAVSGTAFMGAVERSSASADFKGGTVTAVMGGVELDLGRARITSGEAVIDILAFWGAVEIWVPEEWRVEVEATTLLGASEDQTRGQDDHQCLRIRGLILMGAVEVKPAASRT